MRWELEPSEWLLESLLQCIKSNLGILLMPFVPVKDLGDEIIEFHEDRHNWNYILSVSKVNLDIPNELTIPDASLVEELHFQWKQRATYIQIKTEPEHIVT